MRTRWTQPWRSPSARAATSRSLPSASRTGWPRWKRCVNATQNALGEPIGKLYVAKFNDDGTGDWLELTIDDPAIIAEIRTALREHRVGQYANTEIGESDAEGI